MRAFDAVSPLSGGYMGFTAERLVVDPGDSKIVRRSHEGKASRFNAEPPLRKVSQHRRGLLVLVAQRPPGCLLELLFDVWAEAGEGADVDLVVVRLDSLTLFPFGPASRQKGADDAGQ